MTPSGPSPDLQSRMRGALVGLAAGDAVGTTVEFMAPGTFPPVTDMTGGGPFSLPAGAWTDDTSMALCLATSLSKCNDFNPADQMTRYVRWMQEGYLSSTGTCFDIGITTSGALRAFMRSGAAYSGSADPDSAGNGSIMRLAPVPMFFYPDAAAVIHYSGESSRTTHGAQECIDACRLYGRMLHAALDGKPKAEILFGAPTDTEATVLDHSILAPKIRQIAEGVYRAKSVDEITGSGYVVASLEAALWAFWTTESYRDAILAAVNLGDDADTTAAVCGQIAGAYYGLDNIPQSWRAQLVMHDEIVQLADALAKIDI